MAQVAVIVEHRPEFKAIYGLNLSVYLGVKAVTVSTTKELIDYLKDNSCTLIFVDNEAYSTDVAKDVAAFLSKGNLKIPLYIKGKTEAPHTEVNVFESKMDLKNILQSMAKWLNVTAKNMAALELPEYYPLPLELIIPGWFCSTEVYKKSKDEFVTLFNTEDVILSDTLDDLASEGVQELFVKSEKRLRFVNSISSQIASKLNNPDLSYEERLKVTATGYQMVMEQARRLGISQGALEMTNSCITSIEKIVDDTPNVANLLKDLMSQQAGYRYKHSLLICYVGGHIIQKMDWGSLEQRKKLVFVSFFHDIALTSDEMAMIRSDEELEKTNLSDKDKKIVKYHAILAARMVSKIARIPIGADTIIKQHHGSKNGDTLNEISQILSPLAIVFIISEEWAHHLVKHEDSEKKVEKDVFVKYLNEKYKIPAFKKILGALSSLEF